MENLRTEIRSSADALRTELLAEIRSSADALRTDLRALEQRLDDFDHNSRARVLNNVHPLSTLRLYPLKNTTTHELVLLPRTLGDLDDLSSADLGLYLEALGQTPEQTAAARKVQLMEYIGIRAS